MFGRRRREQASRPAPQWTREKMLALLVGAGVTGLILVVGLGLAVFYAFTPHTSVHDARGTSDASSAADSSAGSGTGQSGGGSVTDAWDALAAMPMAHVDAAASHPAAVSTQSAGVVIVLPPATVNGPAGVPTGYPHTPAGAMAQLIAIDQVAMQSASSATARDVITQWAVPGGPTATSWSVVQALATLLSQAQNAGTPQLALVLTPLMGQVKGSVGPDFVVPCIDFELDITLQQTARGAVADCQRMVWQPDTAAGAVGGRWMVAAGSEPATPPSVWPDTDLAIAVGYHDLKTAG